jgi:hypothetical protein
MLELLQTVLGLKPEGLVHPLPRSKAPVPIRGKRKKARRADTLVEHILLVILNFMFRKQS